jgi:hypothetical protein
VDAGCNQSGVASLLDVASLIFEKGDFGRAGDHLIMPYYMQVELATLKVMQFIKDAPAVAGSVAEAGFEVLNRESPTMQQVARLPQGESDSLQAQFIMDVNLRVLREFARQHPDSNQAFKTLVCSFLQPLDLRSLPVQGGETDSIEKAVPHVPVAYDDIDAMLDDECVGDCSTEAEPDSSLAVPDVETPKRDLSFLSEDLKELLLNIRNIVAPELATQAELERAMRCLDDMDKLDARPSDHKVMAIKGTLSLPMLSRSLCCGCLLLARELAVAGSRPHVVS